MVHEFDAEYSRFNKPLLNLTIKQLPGILDTHAVDVPAGSKKHDLLVLVEQLYGSILVADNA